MTPRHIMVATIPAWGHTFPLFGGVAELVRRGHRVSMLASDSFTAEVTRVADPLPYASPMDAGFTGSRAAPAVDILPELLDEARAAWSALERHALAHRPDLVVYDVTAWSGWALATRLRVPAICSWPVFASNAEFSLHDEYVVFDNGSDGMQEFFGNVAAFLSDVGLAEISPMAFFENEADRNIVLFPRAFQPAGHTFDARFTFVRPCIRAPEQSADRGWLDRSNPLLVVSLGTIYNDNAPFFRACVDASAVLGWHAAVSIGDRVRPEDVGGDPARVLVRRRLPMIDTLRRATVLVSHGGMSSTIEALHHGVPLLLVPQIGEQDAVADRIEVLGLGRRLREPFDAAGIAKQVAAAAADVAMRDRVTRFQALLRAESGAAAFADAVERAMTPSKGICA
ncbi:MAG: macrolide family glycosyltransferase [Pseudonocardia sp.]